MKISLCETLLPRVTQTENNWFKSFSCKVNFMLLRDICLQNFWKTHALYISSVQKYRVGVTGQTVITDLSENKLKQQNSWEMGKVLSICSIPWWKYVQLLYKQKSGSYSLKSIFIKSNQNKNQCFSLYTCQCKFCLK